MIGDEVHYAKNTSTQGSHAFVALKARKTDWPYEHHDWQSGPQKAWLNWPLAGQASMAAPAE